MKPKGHREIDLTESAALYDRAIAVIAGGVTSARRRTSALDHPIYFERGAGAYLWDVEGNRYIDYSLAFGTALIGHASEHVRTAVRAQLDRGLNFGAGHRLEVEAAELLVSIVPNAEQCLLASTGTDAVLTALRIARAQTGRSKIIKMEGSYHGAHDGVYVNVGYDPEAAGQTQTPNIQPESEGMSPGAVGDALVAPYNDLEAVEALLADRGDEIAAVLVEPVQAVPGFILPVSGYLEGLRRATKKAGCLLVFDEVITGFRLALGGGQEYFGVEADLATFGKSMGGTTALSAVTGPREAMEPAASHRAIHAGTFNANPLACAAGVATMSYLRDNHATIYPRIFALGQRLAYGLREVSDTLCIRGVGPMQNLAVSEPEGEICSIRDLQGTDRSAFMALAAELLRHGVHTPSPGFCYISTCHSETDIDATIETAQSAVETLGM